MEVSFLVVIYMSIQPGWHPDVGFYMEDDTVIISYDATLFGQQYVAYSYLFWHACNNKVQDIITSTVG